MAHEIVVDLSSHPLSREENAVEFRVSDDDGKFGELRVSKGGVRWKPRNKKEPHFATWRELDQFMRDQPKR
jgi:hypothetical protein